MKTLAMLSLVICFVPQTFGNGTTLPLTFNIDESRVWNQKGEWIATHGRAKFPIKAFGSGVAMFSSTEPQKGMKWLIVSLKGKKVPNFLVMRYRAENLNNGASYLLWGGWVSNPQWHILRPKDLKQDGNWHVVAVDLKKLGVTTFPSNLAINVVAAKKLPASLWVDYIDMVDKAPAQAHIADPSK